jgi:hypothetical protein
VRPVAIDAGAARVFVVILPGAECKAGNTVASIRSCALLPYHPAANCFANPSLDERAHDLKSSTRNERQVGIGGNDLRFQRCTRAAEQSRRRRVRGERGSQREGGRDGEGDGDGDGDARRGRI